MNEEDIKILEYFINNVFQKDKLEMNEKGGLKIGTIYKVTELNPAIEHLIKAYKELEEENKKLSKANEIYIKIYVKSIQNIALFITNDYIEKSLIKEKIEKIDKKINDIPENEGDFSKAILIRTKITLQELLEG